MAVAKKKKYKMNPLEDEEDPIETENDDLQDESEKVELKKSSVRYAPPPYLLIFLLMAVSFFSGYLLFKVLSLQKTLADMKQTPQAAAGGQQAPAAPTEVKITKPTTSEHWKGSKNVRYVMVEYSDFECPFCQRFHPDIVRITNEYEGKVAWVYRHYPLSSIHPKAQKASELSECVNEVNGNEGFWKITDLLFEKLATTEIAQFPALGAEVGADEGSIKECLDSNKFEKKVKDQADEGAKAGIQATPSTVIYDLKTGKSLFVEGAQPYEQVKNQLDTFMKANGS